MTAMDPGWRAERLQQPLSEVFAISQDRLTPAGLRLDLLEVSWAEWRSPWLSRIAEPWRWLVLWLLEFRAAQQRVRITVRLTGDGSIEASATHERSPSRHSGTG
jgi:hypothetical protein